MEKKKKKRKRPTKASMHRKFLNEHRHKYDQILEEQGGHCALCARKPTQYRRLDLDHSHTNLVIRGLLCVVCNRALREFMDEEWLKKAIVHVNTSWNEV